MFEPMLVENGTTTMVEYGIFDAKLNRWLAMRDGVIELVPGAQQLSLRDSFPHPEAGSEAFAHRVLDELDPAALLFDQYEVRISDYGIRQCAVYSLRVRRPHMVESGIEIERHDSHHTIFDLRGPASMVLRWESNHTVANPSALITCLESGRNRMVRVFERSAEFA